MRAPPKAADKVADKAGTAPASKAAKAAAKPALEFDSSFIWDQDMGSELKQAPWDFSGAPPPPPPAAAAANPTPYCAVLISCQGVSLF